jgi:cell division protein FtsW
MQDLKKAIKGDRVIWAVTIILSLFSILAVYSSISTLAVQAGGNTFKFLFKHTLMIAAGLSVMFLVHKINIKYFSKLSIFMIWIAGLLLLFTLLFGADINNAKRWIELPLVNMTFQTSDFAKIALILYVARMLTVKRTVLHSFKEGVLPVLMPIVVICGLILPADFSTAAMLAAICLLMMFIGGVPGKYIFSIIGLGLVSIALIYMIGKTAPDVFDRFGTWVNRIESFMDKESDGNYQIEYAQVAIHEGGVFPNGPGSGSSRNFLPHPYSDMIFAFVIEEYGSVFGGLGLVLLYLILLFRSIKTATRCPKHFGGLMVLGLSLMLVIQAMINMAVAVNLFPTTGQPLPLVSMGGTSIIFTCLAIGMVLSASRMVYNPEEFEETKSNKNQKNPVKKTTDKTEEEEYAVA